MVLYQKYNQCKYIGCKNNRRTRPGLSFFRFPKDPERCRLWLENVKNDYLLDVPIEQLHMKYVCGEHFLESAFMNAKKRNSLTQLAVPIAFEPNSTPLQNDVVNSPTPSTDSVSGQELVVEGNEPTAESEVVQETPCSPQIHFDSHAHESQVLDSERSETLLVVDSTMEAMTPLNRAHKAADKVCRVCATAVDCTKLIHIYGEKSITKKHLDVMNILLPPTDQIKENDYLPQWICVKCSEKLDSCKQLMDSVREANTKLKEMFVTSLKRKTSSVNNKVAQNRSLSHLTSPEPSEWADETGVHRGEVYRDFTEVESVTRQQTCITNGIYEENNLLHNECFDSVSGVGRSIGFDSYKFKCSQCSNTFSSKHGLFHHEISEHTLSLSSKITETLHPVIKRVDKFRYRKPCILKKAKLNSNQVNSSSCPNILYRTTDVSAKSLVDASDLSLSSQSKRPKMSSEMRESRAMMKESPNRVSILKPPNKNSFLCNICEKTFETVESLLSHRFKEHPHVEFVEEKLNRSVIKRTKTVDDLNDSCGIKLFLC